MLALTCCEGHELDCTFARHPSTQASQTEAHFFTVRGGRKDCEGSRADSSLGGRFGLLGYSCLLIRASSLEAWWLPSLAGSAGGNSAKVGGSSCIGGGAGDDQYAGDIGQGTQVPLGGGPWESPVPRTPVSGQSRRRFLPQSTFDGRARDTGDAGRGSRPRRHCLVSSSRVFVGMKKDPGVQCRIGDIEEQVRVAPITRRGSDGLHPDYPARLVSEPSTWPPIECHRSQPETRVPRRHCRC